MLLFLKQNIQVTEAFVLIQSIYEKVLAHANRCRRVPTFVKKEAAQSRRPVIPSRHSQNGGQFEVDIPEAPHIGTGVVLRCLTIHNPSALTR